MKPRPCRSAAQEVLGELAGRRLIQAESAYSDTTPSDRPAKTGVPAPGDMFRFDDPVPAYKPLASNMR